MNGSLSPDLGCEISQIPLAEKMRSCGIRVDNFRKVARTVLAVPYLAVEQCNESTNRTLSRLVIRCCLQMF